MKEKVIQYCVVGFDLVKSGLNKLYKTKMNVFIHRNIHTFIYVLTNTLMELGIPLPSFSGVGSTRTHWSPFRVHQPEQDSKYKILRTR